MRIAKRTDYGVRALLDLAQRYGQGPVQSADIAARQGIPESFLDQVLATLHKAGLVRSTRGPQGGHALAAPPDQITVAQAVTALEGPMLPMACVAAPAECDWSGGCALREVWQDLSEASQRVLSSRNIGELARRHRARAAATTYHI